MAEPLDIARATFCIDFALANMDAISITALASFFSDEPKSLQRGENHYKSDHVEKFDYFPGELRGVVRASMKDKSYNVVVSFVVHEKMSCLHINKHKYERVGLPSVVPLAHICVCPHVWGLKLN